ncbi:MAG: nicotinate (nicotinamide) nucleotide adenylyltransferase [Phycisphaeraceae bacterium]|nr:nicotinate (nicotinamide) nucleotide adenylyltransferase [Phycisphaeraceae bacterium]
MHPAADFPRRTPAGPATTIDLKCSPAPPGASPPLILFGGTFDPIHLRHIELAELARDLLGASEVLFMVAQVNPQRVATPPAPVNARMDMVRRAIEGRRALSASDLEAQRQGPSFTVDTLRALRAGGETRPIRLLIGSDQALNFRSWREPEAILTMATPAVVLRPPLSRADFEREAVKRHEPRLLEWLLPIEPVECSSSEARRRLAAGEPVDDLLPRAVVDYLADRPLYRGA